MRSLSINLSIDLHVCVCLCVCKYIHTRIYIYAHTHSLSFSISLFRSLARSIFAFSLHLLLPLSQVKNLCTTFRAQIELTASRVCPKTSKKQDNPQDKSLSQTASDIEKQGFSGNLKS